MSARPTYTPALGLRVLTPFYDAAIAAFTRARTWRPHLVRQIAPQGGMRIVDIGCGTGTLTRALKRAAPGATVIGVDPDAQVLAKARLRAIAAGAEVTYVKGFFDDDFIAAHGPFAAVTISLVLHQVPLEGKAAILRSAFRSLAPSGRLHIADYGVQPGRLMRFAFRNTVQRIDGFEDTEHNARGVLPDLMHEAGFDNVKETALFPTPSGAITLFQAEKHITGELP
ncbi:class I SAM-dependent methyltransferase [Natronohydrobacter thiooxidans]|uniref:class I SAM-dependent methyltransferase n=1 Tax=Natronohydrobacter thiooxidans TaxID=87172 RepID=UPI0008FF42E4|nr:class I SAM-dependent methyltransferase [Natronohydrobacter thiooxidans]